MDRTTSTLVGGVVSAVAGFVSGTLFGDRDVGVRVGLVSGAATALVQWLAYDKVEVRLERDATEIEIEQIDVIDD